jgi:hypothetical protein
MRSRWRQEFQRQFKLGPLTDSSRRPLATLIKACPTNIQSAHACVVSYKRVQNVQMQVTPDERSSTDSNNKEMRARQNATKKIGVSVWNTLFAATPSLSCTRCGIPIPTGFILRDVGVLMRLSFACCSPSSYLNFEFFP